MAKSAAEVVLFGSHGMFETYPVHRQIPELVVERSHLIVPRDRFDGRPQREPCALFGRTGDGGDRVRRR